MCIRKSTSGKLNAPECARDELTPETVEISQQEVEALVKDRQHLEKVLNTPISVWKRRA